MPLRLILFGLPLLLLLAPGSPLADDVGNGRMVVRPSRAVAGSTGNNLTFTFTADPRTLVGDTSIDAPVLWSPFQQRDPSGPGYVQLDHGSCSNKTHIASVTRKRILIKTVCGRGHSFMLTYTNATAARLTADGWVFVTRTRPAPKKGKKPAPFRVLPTKRQPVVRTIGGPATELTLSAPAVVTAGVPFTITPRANDQFGNPASGYVRTVSFTSTDPLAKVPPPYTFSPVDAGSKALAGTVLNTPGTQRIGASDNGGLKAVSGPITVVSAAR
jgi:hypothetical protein